MSGFYQPSENDFDHKADDFALKFEAKERRYKHFDLPLAERRRKLNVDFKLETKPRRFLPLLGYTDIVRKFVRNANGDRIRKEKKRPIRFASHADAAYLQGYTEHLNRFYEQALVDDNSAASVLAYRKGGGTNIHHAKGLFDEITERGDCTVVAMDISGFFDSLDHMRLRNEIAGLLGATRLEGHHATVWKNITRYSWVETEDLDRVLGKKRKRDGRICTHADFIQHVRGCKNGLVRKHDLPYGIPQGTPVSGLYANIYLRTFDREMIAATAKYGGSYRRYSDDIAVVLPLGAKVDRVVAVVEKMLADFGLGMSVEKTDSAKFQAGRLICAKPIQYLGFTFDGRTILIRPSTLDVYRRKMRRGIHAKFVAAKMRESPIPPCQVYKREALSRYTHLGKRRNFLTYAYKAADIMGSQEIRQQVKPHMTWFKRRWRKEVGEARSLDICIEFF